MSSTCSVEGCPHGGAWAVKIYVPPMGYPARPESSLSIVLSMSFCRRHVEEADVSNFMDVPNEQGATMRNSLVPAIARLVAQQNKKFYVEPDCDRAWIAPVRTNDPEFLLLMKNAMDRS